MFLSSLFHSFFYEHFHISDVTCFLAARKRPGKPTASGMWSFKEPSWRDETVHGRSLAEIPWRTNDKGSGMSQGWTCWRHGSWVLSPGVKTQHSKDYGLSWRPRSQQSGVAVDFQAPKSIKAVTASLPPLNTQVTVRLEVHLSSLHPMVGAWRIDHDLRRHRSSKCCFKDKCSPLIGPHPEASPENSMPSLEGNPVQDWGHERKPGSGCEGLPDEVRPNITEQTLKLATTCNDWLGLLQCSRV